ncbi:MAG: 16S rRNA (guanine(966)-N(2))-methyltransferase RsmD [Desulfotomaculaceae bacterium]|nr:16S rRNA (guanine(966)-N(2))-methyltransferase RsmD [Desulfotomaculaceae bacterium]
MLRVIAGSAKKRQLKSPRGLSVRPTTARVKEALFNILRPLIEGSYFLDLFAGSGNIGIEALSRGALRTVFVEKKIENINIIRQNLSITGLITKADIRCASVDQALQLLGREGQKFDIIFMDPPYYDNLILGTLRGILINNLLVRKGTVVIESSKKDILPPEVVSIKLLRQEKYGDNLLSFYTMN